MIPLRHSENVARFPWPTLALCLLWVGTYFYFPFEGPWAHRLGFSLRHPGALGLLVSLIFGWAFTPRLFERGLLWALAVGAVGAVLVSKAHEALNPQWVHGVQAPQSLLGIWLGMCLRREAWGTLHTWVLGPGWLRVLEVPAYVLLFFWLFYLLIAQLALSGPQADVPMPYLLPLLALLWGFVCENARVLWEKRRAA